jgi:hypothetical protein
MQGVLPETGFLGQGGGAARLDMCPSKKACGCTSLFSREGGSPVWIPAFAGKHDGFTVAHTNHHHHPGEGRGPIGGRW